MDLIIFILIFISSLLVVLLIYFSYTALHDSEAQQVRKRLRMLRKENEGQAIDILRRRPLSNIKWFNDVLCRIPGMQKTADLLIQSDVRVPLGFILLSSLFLGLTGYHTVSHFTRNVLLSLFMAGLFGYSPFLYVLGKKKRRMERFQAQLPDALELIGRTLRAGHAFSGGMQLVSEEFDEPISKEFQKTLDQINFGVSVPDALKDLASRVDCDDLRYFVVSLIIQRETGGNLAEVLDALSHIIRARFKLQGQIKTLSAEGKMSAVILCCLPFVLALLISFLKPGYIEILKEDPFGRILVLFACALMAVGILVTRKMIRFRV